MSRTIIVNGEARPWRDQSMLDLLAEFDVGHDRPGVAVALNAEILRRGAWPATRLVPGDRIEIVHIVRRG